MIPANFPYPHSLIEDITAGIGAVFDHIKWQEDQHLEEVVGIMVKGGSAYHLTNQARSHRRFQIGPTQFDDVVATLPPNSQVLCFYHSHPTGNLSPSIEDQQSILLQFAAGVTMAWLIATINPFARARLHWVDPQWETIASYDFSDERIAEWQTSQFPDRPPLQAAPPQPSLR